MRLLPVTWRWLLAAAFGGAYCLPLTAHDPPQAAPAPVEQGQTPPPSTLYMGREIAPTLSYQHADWLTRPERDQEEDCGTLLQALKIEPGQVVCDYGCGSGFYSLRLAKLTGDKGRVVAVDIQPEMLHMLEKRAQAAGIKNIDLVQATLTDPKLAAESLDLVILVDVYHELTDPANILTALRKCLKPSGRLAMVEFRLEDATVPIKLLHKMSKDQIAKELTANGFKACGEYDKLPWQHLMFFERDDSFSKGSR